MAKIDAVGSLALRMDAIAASDVSGVNVTQESSSSLTLDLGGGAVFHFTGHDLAYSAGGVPVSGTITGFENLLNGAPQSEWARLSVDASQIGVAIHNHDVATLLADALAGNDTITGGSGNDVLYGGAGVDTIQGGAGDDVINGGAGRDTMTGGAGADTFTFSAASDSTVATPDYITDFQTGSDKIDLSALHTGASDTLKIVSNGGYTYVEVDQGGDGSIDTMIKLAGANAVKASDVVWGSTSTSSGIHDAAAADHATALHQALHESAHDLALFA